MTPSLWRSSLRYLWSHPWLFGLSIVGVAMGVAMVVSIDLANVSAQEAFELSAETVTGRATHQVRGAGEGLDEEVYRQLRVEHGVRPAGPVVEGYATVPDAGRTFQVLGIDPIAEGPFRSYASQDAGIALDVFMARGQTALIAEPVAETLGRAPGDTLQVRIGGRDRTLIIAGLLAADDERSRQALESVMVVDISTAQELFDMPGRLSRIDLIIDTDAERNRIEGLLPESARLDRSEARTETVEQMTRAFELNLQALSLLALVVGMFLIYNTMTFSVIQRRPLIGRLRALGVTRREIWRLILGEALLIGTLGTAVGLALGLVLAQGLVVLVTQTINDLYYVLTVRELTIDAWTLTKGALLGLGATLLATVWPAREATNAPASTVLQRSSAEASTRKAAPRLALGGLLLGLIGGGLLLIPGDSIALSYAALFLLIIGFSLLIPLVITGMAAGLRPVMDRLFGLIGRMAARGVVTTLSRTAVAIAALVVAVAATVGVGIMIDSFRSTVQVWLEGQLQADVYVQPPSLVFRQADATLDAGVVATFRAAEGVRDAHTVRSVHVETTHGRSELVAIEFGPSTREAYRIKAGDPSVWDRLGSEPVVIVSEPYAYRHDAAVGDTIDIQTDEGTVPFEVGAVYFDYASDLGVITIGRPVYDRYFEDDAVSGLALYTTEAQPVEELVARLRTQVPEGQEVIIRSNQGLREASLEVFDRTFTVTVVLRLLAVLVAFVGVLSALMALQLERSRELAVLRANGMTPRQLWQYVTSQTGVMGLMAGLLAVPLGLILATVLVYVINRRSFGWTLQFNITPEILLQAVGLALVAALLAGLYPSYKMAQANPADALREE